MDPEEDEEDIAPPNAPADYQEDLLGSDLDDDEDENDGILETDNIVLCLFDKVTKTKSKWRCSLKDGIMHLNGTDYAFHRATGEFEWV